MSNKAFFLTRLLFPNRCLFCRDLLPGASAAVCLSCEEDLPLTPAGSTHALEGSVCVAPFYYEDAVRDLVHRFKFRGKYALGSPMSAYIAHAAECLPRSDLVSWVPVSRTRLRKRGYDQAEILARETGILLGLPPVQVLRKVRDSPTQNRLSDRDARARNVAGAFSAVGETLKGQRILLVDDVCTSGATLEECVSVLSAAGASGVVCAVFARTRRYASH